MVRYMELQLKPVMKQEIKLTQGMLQSLNILGYSSDELHSLLMSKQEENPFLKVRYKRTNHIEFSPDIKDCSIDFAQQIIEQLLHLKVSKRLSHITKLILSDLSETGFLTQTPNELALCFRASAEEIQEALLLLKQCEPEGLGCANLQEFLGLQAEKCPSSVKDILENHYELFLHQKWIELTQKSGYSREEIKEVCEHVSRMKTRPLPGIQSENLLIKPDVLVTIKDGMLRTRFYEHAYPQVSFDYNFDGELKERKEVDKYLKNYFEEVKTLKEQLEVRRDTIRKVTEEIVERQADFFRRGPEFLKSLTMTEISQKLNVHVSTISRAVREKYLSTPHGTFAFRHFFTTSNQFLNEDKMTVNQVKKYILLIIKSEDGRKPISDQEIANKLKDKGIDISRRVIAKYRQQLNVPASSKRKELFLLNSGC